jgi:AcrR family transcriptional regulator
MDVNSRRQPKQSRSKATVDAIVIATTQILIEQGYAALTTNRVAEVAGVSIGSLYQYFNGKESLIKAVTERHTENMLTLLRTTLADSVGTSVPTAVRSFVRAMLNAHSLDPELHRICVQQAFQLGLEHILEIRRTAEEVVSFYLQEHAEAILPHDIRMASSILVTTVDANIHSALLSPVRPDMDALGEEVIAMVLRYLGIPEDGDVPSPAQR